jgi:O-antigen ligase
MKVLIILFLASLLLGQLGGISLFPGVVVYVHDILLLVLVIFSAVPILKSHTTAHGKLLTPIAAFIGACIVSLLANYWRFPQQSLLTGSLYLVRWTFYSYLYILVLQDLLDVNFWLRGLYGVGIGFGILGLMQFFLYPDLRNLMYLGWDPHYYRLFSTLLDPNFVGIVLVLTLILGCGLWKKKQKNFFLMIGQLIGFVSLLLTYSRSSYVSFAMAVVCLAAWTKQWKVVIALALFAGLVFILPRTSGSTLSLLRSDSALARVGNWQESLNLIAKAPLFGFGFDTLRYIQPVSAGFVSKAAAGLDSSILFILATTGVVGLAAYAYLFILMIRSGTGMVKKANTRSLGLAYLASLVAVVVHSLFVNSLFYPWVMIWMWVLAGVATYDT